MGTSTRSGHTIVSRPSRTELLIFFDTPHSKILVITECKRQKYTIVISKCIVSKHEVQRWGPKCLKRVRNQFIFPEWHTRDPRGIDLREGEVEVHPRRFYETHACPLWIYVSNQEIDDRGVGRRLSELDISRLEDLVDLRNDLGKWHSEEVGRASKQGSSSVNE